jgi:hypothetical protein
MAASQIPIFALAATGSKESVIRLALTCRASSWSRCTRLIGDSGAI